MLPLNDPKWKTLNGGYGIPYDASGTLMRLENETDCIEIWLELWDELHHQGDIGDASLASVPHIVRIHEQRHFTDYNPYALVSTIEIERDNHWKTALPSWLAASYQEALERLYALGIRDLQKETNLATIRAIIGFITYFKGDKKLGTLISNFDDSEIDELYDEFYGE